MRRIILYFFLTFTVINSFAQSHPLGKVMNGALELMEQGRWPEAYNYWENNGESFKTDSLFVWANAFLAQSFMNQGLYAESESLLNCAENTLTLLKSDSYWWWQHRGYVSTRKASLYGSMHDYTLARACASDAKIAYENISDRGIDYAQALIVLAEAAFAKGDYVLSRIIAGEAFYYAFLVFNSTQQDEHYQTLAYVLREQGLIEAGLGLPENAIKTFEILKTLNRQYNIYDSYIDYCLGLTYVSNGDYEKAIDCLTPFYEKCGVLTTKITSGANLLYAKYKEGHKDISQLAYEVAKYQAENTSRMFSFMSDQEKEQWWKTNENRIISIADAILIRSGLNDVNGIIADNEIFSKGLLLRSSNMLKEAALGSNDERIVESYKGLERLRSKLTETSDSDLQKALEKEISALEKELQRSLNISIDKVSSWRDVASSLGNKEVAIEFVRFESFDDTDDAEYYATIVKKGAKEPIILHLFDESSLKLLLDNPRNKPINKYVLELYSTGTPQYKGDKVYDLIWSKLEKEIKGCKTIYYSPAGLLNSISLQAITSGKQYLGQKYVMHLVSSIGVIPRLKSSPSNVGKQAVIYGGVFYDANETELIQASRSYSRGGSSTWDQGISTVRSGWKRLPGTETEAKEIGTLLSSRGYSVKQFSGIDANEESFKALTGKELNTIHIATHGFYLSEQKEINRNAFLNPLMLDNVGRIDPMLRSGLLFAGANRAWTGKRNIEGIEDGILTAKEITSLDFSKVGLIVLSACQTGLGEVEANEGVYGLQRAFKLAGAETLIMSLWEVDDRATSLLMKSFYERYLNGETKDNAFRDAINTVRNYKDKNGDVPFASPYYWASFIMMD